MRLLLLQKFMTILGSVSRVCRGINLTVKSPVVVFMDAASGKGRTSEERILLSAKLHLTA